MNAKNECQGFPWCPKSLTPAVGPFQCGLVQALLQKMREWQLFTSWLLVHSGQFVAVGETRAARRTDHLSFSVGQYVIGRYLGRRATLRFQGPLLDRGTDLPKVIDANILLRRPSGFQEIWNGNRRQ